jgi:O-succinylbenzoate synthase
VSRATIAAGLSNATSPITQAIIASANYQTAAICAITKQQPGNVCTSAGVKAADKAMGLK